MTPTWPSTGLTVDVDAHPRRFHHHLVASWKYRGRPSPVWQGLGHGHRPLRVLPMIQATPLVGDFARTGGCSAHTDLCTSAILKHFVTL